MTFEVWLSYAGTVLVLMSTPGPSQLLMLSNSINHGFGKSAYTAAGDLTANFPADGRRVGWTCERHCEFADCLRR